MRTSSNVETFIFEQYTVGTVQVILISMYKGSFLVENSGGLRYIFFVEASISKLVG